MPPNSRKPKITAPRIGKHGRKFGPKLRETIIAYLLEGHSINSAAALSGIWPRTLKGWIDRGWDNVAAAREYESKADDGLELEPVEVDDYGRFALLTLWARVRADAGPMQVLRRAALAGDWRAALAWLERRNPGEFGEVVTSASTAFDEHGGRGEDPADEILRKLAKQADRTRGQGDD